LSVINNSAADCQIFHLFDANFAEKYTKVTVLTFNRKTFCSVLNTMQKSLL